MSKYPLVLLVFIFSLSCTHQVENSFNTVDREPASEQKLTPSKQDFFTSLDPAWLDSLAPLISAVLNQSNPKAFLDASLQQLLTLDSRINNGIKAFDTDLARQHAKFKAAEAAKKLSSFVYQSPIDSRNYWSLHAFEANKIKVEKQIALFALKALEFSEQELQKGNKALSSRYFSTWTYFRNYIAQAAIHPEYGLFVGEINELLKPFANLRMPQSEAESQVVLPKFSKKDLVLTPEQEKEIMQMADELRAEFQGESQRDPAQARANVNCKLNASNSSVFPSSGPAGTISGKEFPTENTWTLTFDDGPHPRNSQAILDILKAGNMTGTFFWLGQEVRKESNKTVIANFKASPGMVLANHSMSHVDLSKIAPFYTRNINAEILQPDALMTRVFGFKPQFFRCPYGSCLKQSQVRQALANNCYIHVQWNIDSLDWDKRVNPSGAIDIFNRVKMQMDMVKKGIILFHDIHPQSVEATRLTVDYINSLRASTGARAQNMCEFVNEYNSNRTDVCAKR